MLVSHFCLTDSWFGPNSFTKDPVQSVVSQRRMGSTPAVLRHFPTLMGGLGFLSQTCILQKQKRRWPADGNQRRPIILIRGGADEWERGDVFPLEGSVRLL